MTPKEKAKELYFKFYSKIPSIQDEGETQYEASKQCVLIAVDEILKSNPTIIDCDKTELNYKYWQEVKQEIEKL